MNPQEELCKKLDALGFIEYKSSLSFAGVRYFYKDRVNGPPCTANGAAPSINISVQPVGVVETEYVSIKGSASITVFGELREDVWTEYTLYAIPYDKVTEILDDAKKALGLAWSATCEVFR